MGRHSSKAQAVAAPVEGEPQKTLLAGGAEARKGDATPEEIKPEEPKADAVPEEAKAPQEAGALSAEAKVEVPSEEPEEDAAPVELKAVAIDADDGTFVMGGAPAEPPRTAEPAPVARPAEAPAEPPKTAEPMPAAGPTEASDPTRVDFSGSWTVCTKVEGDVETFLVDMGVAWPVRRIAKLAGYGVGKQKMGITQDGDSFDIEIPGRKTVKMCFVADSKEHRTNDMEGNPCSIIAWWEGGTLHQKIKKDDGGAVPTMKRYMSGATMVMDLSSPKGTTIKRISERAA